MTGIKAGLAAVFLPGAATVAAEAGVNIPVSLIVTLAAGAVVALFGWFLTRIVGKWDTFMTEQTAHNAKIERCISEIQVDREGERVKVATLWEASK